MEIRQLSFGMKASQHQVYSLIKTQNKKKEQKLHEDIRQDRRNKILNVSQECRHLMKIDELYRHTHNENEMREQHKKKRK